MNHLPVSRLFGVACVLALLMAVLSIAPAGPATATTPFDCDGFTCTDVTFTGGNGLTLHGTVIGPAEPHAQLPGIVLVGGSGPVPRTQVQYEARAFAAAGLTALVYDKRTDGYSYAHRDFSLLADDTLAAVQTLRRTTGVRADQVGVWGFSEGGWVAPLAASRSGDIAFVLTLGASGFSPLRTQTWSLAMTLRHRGAGGSLSDTIAGPAARLLGDTGAFPEANFDPLPALAALHIPVLALWGQYDVQVPPAESAAVLRNTLTAAPSVTIGFLPDTAHNGRATTDGFDRLGTAPSPGAPRGAFAPGYLDTMTTWIHRVTGGTPPPSSAATPPIQAVTSSDPGHGWTTSARTQLALIAALVLVFTICLWRTFAHRDTHTGSTTRRRTRALVCTGLLSVLATVAYAISILAFNARTTGPIIASRPLAWLVLQLLAVLTAALFAGSALAAVRTKLPIRQRFSQVAPLLAGCLWFTWSITWGLFTF
ncbi:alpha/beta hydrolase family protein [Nocardia sp. NPDC056000]|uniref:alpha/beta hydrolase family protein n=1 Tax=Nocardia sp. NPDC056000 TaxID=3345674 RepID=UPI0035DBA744